MENDTLLNKAEELPKLLVLDVRNKTEIGKDRLCYSLYSYSLLNKLIEPNVKDNKKQKTHIKQIWKSMTSGFFPIKNSNKNDKNNLYKNPNLQITYYMLFISIISKTNILIFSEKDDRALQVAKNYN